MLVWFLGNLQEHEEPKTSLPWKNLKVETCERMPFSIQASFSWPWNLSFLILLHGCLCCVCARAYVLSMIFSSTVGKQFTESTQLCVSSNEERIVWRTDTVGLGLYRLRRISLGYLPRTWQRHMNNSLNKQCGLAHSKNPDWGVSFPHKVNNMNVEAADDCFL